MHYSFYPKSQDSSSFTTHNCTAMTQNHWSQHFDYQYYFDFYIWAAYIFQIMQEGDQSLPNSRAPKYTQLIKLQTDMPRSMPYWGLLCVTSEYISPSQYTTSDLLAWLTAPPQIKLSNIT